MSPPPAGAALVAGGLIVLALAIARLATRPHAAAAPLGASAWRARAWGAIAVGAAHIAGAAIVMALGLGRGIDVVELIIAMLAGGLATRLARHQAWRPAAAFALAGLVMVIAGHLMHSLLEGIPSLMARPHSLHSLLVSLVLAAAEAASLALVVLHAFYALDAVGARRLAGPLRFRSTRRLPSIAVMVAVFNEPVPLVRETLASLAKLRYPRDRLRVMVLDDSTDESVRAGVEQACARYGFQLVRREGRAGFKAGALNHADTLLGDDVELVAVLDADFQVDPAWLRTVVPRFEDPEVALVQSPQAYRNSDESFLTRQYDAQDAYFYGCVMPSRAAANSIIFCGTMGVVRRTALRDIGGWSESHICEDSEMSLRLIEAGHKGVYEPRVLGRGLIPSTFEAYKRQQHRWAFGNVRVALDHWRLLRGGRLDPRQRLDFLTGFLHWFDGAFIVAIAACLAVLGFAYAGGLDVVSHHRGEVALVALVPLALLLDAILRLHAALGRSSGGSLRRTLSVLGLWSAIKLNNARAAIQALRGAPLAFERTEKTRGEALGALQRAQVALRQARHEAALAGTLWLAGAGALIRLAVAGAPLREAIDVIALSLWLGLYGVLFATAPLYAYLALPRGSAPPLREAREATVRAKPRFHRRSESARRHA